METPNPRPEPTPQKQSLDSFQADRRAWVRYGSNLEIVCRPPGPGKDMGWTARVRDISAGGLGLVLRHRFRPGTPLLIELRNATGNFCQVIEARVVHVRAVQTTDGFCWHVGCAFVTKLTDIQLKALV